MEENQYLSVIRVWAALAWADGTIAAAEAAAMKRLIEVADLSAEERETALGWLKAEVELDTAPISALGRDARHGIYRAAARLAVIDREVAAAERAFLRRLRQGLQIDETVARDIEKSVPALDEA